MSGSESEEGGKNVDAAVRSYHSSDSSCEEDDTTEVYDEQKAENLVGIGDKTDTMSSQQPQPRRKRFIPKYDVEGVATIILSEETQLLIEMCIGTNVTSQHPWKFVSKAKIMESIDMSAELSEFYRLKEQIEAYEEDMILMGYIADESKDVDEFYLCYTKDSRDHCKQQSDRFIKRQEKKLEKAVQKKPRPWHSLGSEIEINELKPINTRPLIELELKSKFPTVYDPKKFNIRDTNSVRDGYIELTPYRAKYNNVFRRRVDTATQAAPAKIENVAQTVLRYPKNMWTQSIADALGSVEQDAEAGGDTAATARGEDDESSDDAEDGDKKKEVADDPGLASYKAALKRLRRQSYLKMINNFMTSQRSEMDDIVELNTVMDIYCNDYPNLIAEKVSDIYDTMAYEEYVCFTDVRAKDKYVSSVEFHPMWTGIVALSYTDGSQTVMKTVSTKSDPIQRAVYGLNPVMIWSHIDSLMPKLYLESPREVKTLSFCPFEENILIGGCINGQIVVWDITNKLENVESIEVLSETREKYRIAMNAHMDWMKNVQNKGVVQYTALSNLMYCHYGPVTAIKWLSPNFAITPTGKEVISHRTQMFFTGSEDGSVLIWNLSVENVVTFETKKVKKSKRILKRPSGLLVDLSPLKVLDRTLQPCFRIILGRVGQPFILPLACFSLDKPLLKYTYNPKNTGTGRKYFSCEILRQTEGEFSKILYCGSLHGEVRRVSWEGHDFNTGEVVNSQYSDIKYASFIHDGIITACSQNPFLKYITLTVGGKIFALWHDKLVNRPLMWKKRPYRLTDAAWSNYKPSIILVTTSEGSLETWDILVRSDKPISVQTLSGTMLTGVTLHSLPLAKNIIGVSDLNGSLSMMIVPPIFMIENPMYKDRMESLIKTELNVMTLFVKWQDEWMKNNPHIIQEIRRKEGALLAEKEEQKRKEKEEEEKRLEDEAEAIRVAKMRVIGPEEKWQQVIQKLIERTIAVKKRINRAELIEHERPLRELEAQRLEKERRMFEIMKNQKAIFNDTVAILFPEAIKKKEKEKKSTFPDNKEKMKKEFMEDYNFYVDSALKMVNDNPYKVDFSWEATLAEGKERRQALHIYEDIMKSHKSRIEEEVSEPAPSQPTPRYQKPQKAAVTPDEGQ